MRFHLRNLILPAVLILTNCVSLIKDSYMRQQVIPEPVPTGFAVSHVEIIDDRDDFDMREIKIPFMSFPGNHDRISPALTKDHVDLIRSEVGRYFIQGGKEAQVEVHILSAMKDFSASFSAETEYVSVELRIIFTSDSRNAAATGSTVFTISSMDASVQYTEKLYQNALVHSIRKAFNQMLSTING